MVRVLVYPVKGAPYTHEIEPTLENMQELVGGHIQMVSLGAMTGLPQFNPYLLVCNEEGKLLGLPANRVVGFDIIAGHFFIIKEDEQGELVSLSSSEVAEITSFLE